MGDPHGALAPGFHPCLGSEPADGRSLCLSLSAVQINTSFLKRTCSQPERNSTPISCCPHPASLSPPFPAPRSHGAPSCLCGSAWLQPSHMRAVLGDLVCWRLPPSLAAVRVVPVGAVTTPQQHPTVRAAEVPPGQQGLQVGKAHIHAPPPPLL